MRKGAAGCACSSLTPTDTIETPAALQCDRCPSRDTRQRWKQVFRLQLASEKRQEAETNVPRAEDKELFNQLARLKGLQSALDSRLRALLFWGLGLVVRMNSGMKVGAAHCTGQTVF